VLDVDVHVPAGSSVVNVKVTVPVVPPVGVKVTVAGVAVAVRTLNWLVLVVMLPVFPVIVQIPVDALPPTLAPVKAYAAPLHIVAAEPALAVAGAVTVSVTVLLAVPHGPAGSSVVNVNVTVPVVPAVGVKVTVAGVAVAVRTLNWLVLVVMVPVFPVIVQIPVDAPPPTLAPVNV
jgi:hypothetical protein